MKPKVTIEKDGEVTSSSPDDPRLKKRWGYIAALPSEYLIHFRKGKLDEKTSGQGGSCFKHWSDTTFIIPTSLKEIVFEANQLTKDNVDVKIRGMAVYRISDPMRIYKLINFLHRQSAEEKLARMIGDMCRSTSKWLVSNMEVEECIRKRKEDIAEALKKETSYVVAHDQSGWGVEIVTIDIQDVYIQDAEIFNAMQMLFKSEKMRESKLAEMEMERNLELKQLEQERELAEHRKNTELEKAQIATELREKKMDMEKSSAVKKLANEQEVAEHRKNSEVEKARMEAELKAQQIEMEKNSEVKQLQTQQELAEHQKNNAVEKARLEAEIKAQQLEMGKNGEVKKLETQRELAEHQKNNAVEKARIESEIKAQQMEMQKIGEVKKLETELELAEYRKNNELDKAQKEAAIKDEQIKMTKQNEEKQFELDKYRVEQNEEIANYKLEQLTERERQKLLLDFEKAQKEVESQNLMNQEEARALKEKIEAENATSAIMLEKHFTETALPSIADAMAKSLKDVKINILRQDGEGGVTPFHFIFTELMDLLRDRIAPLHKGDVSQKTEE